MKPPTIAALVAIIGAVGAATLYLFFNDWFGAGDLPAMLFWCLPLGALVSFSIRRTLPKVAARRPAARTTMLAAVGALTGFLWTFVVALILGGMIGAFSFPVLYCWTLGGLLGGLAAGSMVARERTFESGPSAT